jgi:hypothetical protein
VSTVPSYYDIPSHRDVREETRDAQRRAAEDAGIKLEHPVTDISARGTKASGYESAFRLWFLEQTVLTRYGKLRGMVDRLVPVFAGLLGCSEDRVKQVRKVYTAFLTV